MGIAIFFRICVIVIVCWIANFFVRYVELQNHMTIRAPRRGIIREMTLTELKIARKEHSVDIIDIGLVYLEELIIALQWMAPVRIIIHGLRWIFTMTRGHTKHNSIGKDKNLNRP